MRRGGSAWRPIPEPHHVPGILDRQMLESAASAQKGNSILPRIPNAFQRAIETPIRTAWAAKQSLKSSELVRFIRRQPECFQWPAKRRRRVLNAIVRGHVSRIVRVEITDDADPRQFNSPPASSPPDRSPVLPTAPSADSSFSPSFSTASKSESPRFASAYCSAPAAKRDAGRNRRPDHHCAKIFRCEFEHET